MKISAVTPVLIKNNNVKNLSFKAAYPNLKMSSLTNDTFEPQKRQASNREVKYFWIGDNKELNHDEIIEKELGGKIHLQALDDNKKRHPFQGTRIEYENGEITKKNFYFAAMPASETLYRNGNKYKEYVYNPDNNKVDEVIIFQPFELTAKNLRKDSTRPPRID